MKTVNVKINPKYLKNHTRPTLKIMVYLLTQQLLDMQIKFEQLTNPVRASHEHKDLTAEQQQALESLSIYRKQRQKEIEEIMNNPEHAWTKRHEQRLHESE